MLVDASREGVEINALNSKVKCCYAGLRAGIPLRSLCVQLMMFLALSGRSAKMSCYSGGSYAPGLR